MTGLSPENIAELTTARENARKIRRAVSVALFDGWTTGVFAALTFIGSIGSFSGMLLGVGMFIVAWRELTQGKALARLDAEAPKKLAVNQCCLGILLILYAGWGIYSAMISPGEYADIIGNAPETAGMLGSVQDLVRTVTLSVYIAMLFIAVFVQGGTALFYQARAKLVRDYLRQTPGWIVELQRSGMNL